MRVLRRKTTTFQDLLEPAHWTLLVAAAAPKTYTDGQLVQQRGDENEALSLVLSGQIVAGNIGLDGSLLASALLGPGECFGEFTLFAGLPRTQNLWTIGKTELCHIKGDLFLRHMHDHPEIAQALLTLTLLRSHELLEALDDQRRLSLAARIAKMLLNVVDQSGERLRVECRQEDIAAMLGVTRVSIGKALKKLEGEGLIRLGYGMIDLLDLEQLKARVEAETQVLPLTPKVFKMRL